MTATSDGQDDFVLHKVSHDERVDGLIYIPADGGYVLWESIPDIIKAWYDMHTLSAQLQAYALSTILKRIQQFTQFKSWWAERAELSSIYPKHVELYVLFKAQQGQCVRSLTSNLLSFILNPPIDPITYEGVTLTTVTNPRSWAMVEQAIRHG